MGRARPRRLLVAVLALALLAGCAGFGGDLLSDDAGPEDDGPADGLTGPASPDDLENLTVSLQTTPCEGPCPEYVVEVCGDGTVAYLGISDVTRAGLHRFEIPQENVTAILEAVSEADVFALEERYAARADDVPASVTTVTVDGRTHRVRNEAGWETGAPEELLELESAIVEQTGIGPWIEAGHEETDDRRVRELTRRDSLCASA